jgi:hypothetical protein
MTVTTEENPKEGLSDLVERKTREAFAVGDVITALQLLTMYLELRRQGF